MQVNADRHETEGRISGTHDREAPAYPELECPCCGERQPGKLLWLDMERVRCSGCGKTFHVWANRAD